MHDLAVAQCPTMAAPQVQRGRTGELVPMDVLGQAVLLLRDPELMRISTAARRAEILDML
ncbi:hypothetical protein [Kutzneria sp. 744]|uniref:hypothetical protein n=1 Tax=Kutzneria sp. (strain 744) TaxID=345341 RepID=UPI0004B8D972|nr:hypothetical protein [Kutzneria sp. 744]